MLLPSCTVVVIFLVTRIIAQLVSVRQVEKGDLSLPDTARTHAIS